MDSISRDVFPQTEHLLLFLLVGLEAQREQEAGAKAQSSRFYPYPPTLRAAWNALGCHGLTPALIPPVPRTLSGLLARCTRPAGEWLPPQFIPADFPANAPLLYGGAAIELSDAASFFLNDRLFTDLDFGKIKLHDAFQLNRFLENQRFVALLKKLRAKTWTPELQAEYVLLRRFLIENPYTTRQTIARIFASASVLSPAEIGALYENVSSHEVCFRCENCGLLRTVFGSRLVGAKPDVCSDHAQNAPHVHRVEWEEALCRLVPGVHARVALHGIAEVTLFDRLHALAKKFPKRIVSVEEWPDIDSCDLRVVFADNTAWAADIKDFADPHRLSSELVPLQTRGDYARFDRAFYVVPGRRLATHPLYLTDARNGADKLPADTDLCDDDTFFARVAACRPAKKEKAI